jgi:cell division septum initiation protein DivIVA
MTPEDTDLCALLRQVKPEYVAGVWFEPRKAADALEAQQAEIERMTERVQWFESSGGVAAHTRVHQEIARAERAEAECERLLKALQVLRANPNSHDMWRIADSVINAALAAKGKP